MKFLSDVAYLFCWLCLGISLNHVPKIILFSNQMYRFAICILTHPFGDGLGEGEEGHGDEQVGSPVRRSRQGLAQAPEITWPNG